MESMLLENMPKNRLTAPNSRSCQVRLWRPMPKLKKKNVLKNLKVAWAPQVNSKKRKLADMEKENVSTN